MALSIFLRDSIERRVSTSLVMETNEAGSGIIRKRPSDEIINWNYGGERGVSRNRTTLISSVLFTISRQNGDRETGLFRCSSCCNKLPRLSTGKELLARKWNDPLFPFFFFYFDIQWNWTRSRHDAFFLLSVESSPWTVVSLYVLARTINFNKKTRTIKF